MKLRNIGQHPTLRMTLPWVVTLALLAMCIPYVQYEEIVSTMESVQPVYLVVGTLLLVLDRWLMALRWHILLRVGAPSIRFSEAFIVLLKASAVALFLPAIGGDVTKLMYLRKRLGPQGWVLASLVLDRVIGLVTTVLVAAVGLSLIALYSGINELHITVFLGFMFLTAVALVGLAILIRSGRSAIRSGGTPWQITVVVRQRVRTLSDALSSITRGPKVMAAAAAVAVMEQSVQIAALTVIAIGLGLEKLTLFVGIATLQFLVLRLPITPDGWGLGEFTAVQYYSAAGMTPEAGLLAMLLFHACVMLVVGPALALMVRDGLRSAAAGAGRALYQTSGARVPSGIETP